MNVSERFLALLENIRLSVDQTSDGETKHRGVRNCLNQVYYGTSDDFSNSMLVGSWGKKTRTRPPRDVDVLFSLPLSTFTRFNLRSGNKQSQLLQEIKSHLKAKYSSTNIKGDGPVVVIPFGSFSVELVPGFKLTNGQFWIPITSGVGSYKAFDPDAEIKLIEDSDTATNGNTRALIRIMKRWQEYCSVPCKSFWIELLAADFLRTWQHRSESSWYFDWMVRDFLAFLILKANTYVLVPGTSEMLWLGDAWKSRAETALLRARKACAYESENMLFLAGSEWQKIFGSFIPAG